MYVVDSDNIHYTNILRIMSAKRRSAEEGGRGAIYMEDRMFYQSLFATNRRRSSSIVSGSTHHTRGGSEVWDANLARSKHALVPKKDPAEGAQPVEGETFRS